MSEELHAGVGYSAADHEVSVTASAAHAYLVPGLVKQQHTHQQVVDSSDERVVSRGLRNLFLSLAEMFQ